MSARSLLARDFQEYQKAFTFYYVGRLKSDEDVFLGQGCFFSQSLSFIKKWAIQRPTIHRMELKCLTVLSTNLKFLFNIIPYSKQEILIFTFFSRNDIYNIATANKRIHFLAREKSLDIVKWEKGELIMFQVISLVPYVYFVPARLHERRANK